MSYSSGTLSNDSEATHAIVHPDGGQFFKSTNGFMEVTLKEDFRWK